MQPKKKARKQSDKKFTFDWEKEDDTAAMEVDPFYKTAGSYGGIRLAGVDPSTWAERKAATVNAEDPCVPLTHLIF